MVTSTHETTYGPKRFTRKDSAVAGSLALVGICLIWFGLDHNISHTAVTAARSIVAGLLSCALSLVGTIISITNRRKNIPRLTLVSAGVSYEFSRRSVWEARWDSLGPFELTYGGDIRAEITGNNISEKLRREPYFLICFVNLLDADKTALLNELNDRRLRALDKAGSARR